MNKRIFAMLLALAMIISMVPMSAMAAGLGTSTAHVHNYQELKPGEWVCLNKGCDKQILHEDPNAAPEESTEEPEHECVAKNKADMNPDGKTHTYYCADPECGKAVLTEDHEFTAVGNGSVCLKCGKAGPAIEPEVTESQPTFGTNPEEPTEAPHEHKWTSLKEGEWFCVGCGKFTTENPMPEEPEQTTLPVIIIPTPTEAPTFGTAGTEAPEETAPVHEHNWTSLKAGEWFCLDCGKFTTVDPNPTEAPTFGTAPKPTEAPEETAPAHEHNWTSLKAGEWFCLDCGKFTTVNPMPEEPEQTTLPVIIIKPSIPTEPEHKCMAETKTVANKDGLSHSIVCAECGEFWKNEAHNWTSLKAGEWFCLDCGYFTTKDPNPEQPTFGTAPSEPAEPKHEGCLKPETCNGEVLLETVRKEATCGKAGTVELVYPCGKFVVETIPATGEHDFEEGVCTVCGEADPDYVAPCEHDFKFVCYNEKTITYVCKHCGEKSVESNAYYKLWSYCYRNGIELGNNWWLFCGPWLHLFK